MSGKAVDRPDLVIAGDSVICRPVICDALGNKTVPEEGKLKIYVVLPDGSLLHPDVRTCIHTYIHTCLHACIHTHIHTWMHAYMHAYIHT